jgi:hypothetical protein
MDVSGQLHVPAALPPGKEPRYPLDRRLGGLQSRSGRGGEEKNSQPLPGLDPPIIQLVAQRYTAELSRLSLRVIVDFSMAPRNSRMQIEKLKFSLPKFGVEWLPLRPSNLKISGSILGSMTGYPVWMG